jgi:hypothetical protein
VPPELSPDQIVVVHVKTGKDMKKYHVASLGLQYSFGVFDHIVMVKADTKEVNYGDGESEDE